MAITLICEPGVVKTREEFVGTPYGIALDGYVHGAPWFDRSGPTRNFNHHEDVDRGCTRATCAQVAFAIRTGLFSGFSTKNGLPHANVYINDHDQDVCLSTFALLYPETLFGAQPAMNRLLYLEDMLDSAAGLYPVSRDSKRELGWIFAPYVRTRGLSLNGTEALGVIADLHARIWAYLDGKGGIAAADEEPAYCVRARQGALALIEERDPGARSGFALEGIFAFVAYRLVDGGPNYTFTLGRASPEVPFDVSAAITELASTEPGWGGGDTVAGSPRHVGSTQSPQDVWEVARKYYG